MKKTAAILGLILTLALVFCPAAYAGSLAITETVPEDGEGGKQPQNMAVKITFNEAMDDRESNRDKISIKDPEGTEIPFQLVYSEKYPTELWVVLSETLTSNTEYKVHIEEGIQSESGNTMDTAKNLTFKTRNTKTDSYISVAMMMGMMVVMFAASSKAAKKQAEANAAGGNASQVKKADNLNPYKLAKEKNISLEQAKALVEKEKAKQAKQNERIEKERAKKEEALAAEMADIQKRLEEEEEAARKANNFRVKRPHSIKETGRAVPKSIVRKNRKKREAAAAAEKARNKGKKK